jgi:hypothetical protein
MISASGSSHPRKNSWFLEGVSHCVSEMKTNAHCDNFSRDSTPEAGKLKTES